MTKTDRYIYFRPADAIVSMYLTMVLVVIGIPLIIIGWWVELINFTPVLLIVCLAVTYVSPLILTYTLMEIILFIVAMRRA